MTGLTIAWPWQRYSDGLGRFDAGRDLGPLVRLLRMSFGRELDADDLRWLDDLESVSRLGPILSVFGLLAPRRAGFAGYVWYEKGQLVANVSLMPRYGRAWMVANVVTHPHWRRRGIARQLMAAAIEWAWAGGAARLELQVRDDNEPAQALYASLGFRRVFAATTMRLPRSPEWRPLPSADASVLVGEWGPADRGGALRIMRAAGIGLYDDPSSLIAQELSGHRALRALDDSLRGQRRRRWAAVASGEARAILVAVVQRTTGRHRLELASDPRWRGRVEVPLLAAALEAYRFERADAIDAQIRSDEEAAREWLAGAGFEHVKTLDRLVLDRPGAPAQATTAR